MKTCEDCGCRVYGFGCINCNEEAYIQAQWEEDRAGTRPDYKRDLGVSNADFI